MRDRDDARTLDLLDQALQESPGNPTGANQYVGGTVDNVNDSQRPDGNTRIYALRKLRKDRPDLHAEVLAGFRADNANRGSSLSAD